MIKLCGCTGWFVSFSNAHVRRYIFIRCGSYIRVFSCYCPDKDPIRSHVFQLDVGMSVRTLYTYVGTCVCVRKYIPSFWKWELVALFSLVYGLCTVCLDLFLLLGVTGRICSVIVDIFYTFFFLHVITNSLKLKIYTGNKIVFFQYEKNRFTAFFVDLVCFTQFFTVFLHTKPLLKCDLL